MRLITSPPFCLCVFFFENCLKDKPLLFPAIFSGTSVSSTVYIYGRHDNRGEEMELLTQSFF